MRYPLLDWLRGFAILLMVIYHFCYDLFFFGYLDTAFGKGYWIPFRYVIVILFLSLVGIVLHLVHKNGINYVSIKKRSLQLLTACLFVTGSSYFIAADKLTVFGILHLILFCSFASLIFVSRPILALITGIVIFVAGHWLSFAVLDNIWLHWLGMVENKRPALDYVPVFPWFGVVLIGIYVGHLIVSNEHFGNTAKIRLAKNGRLDSRFHVLLEKAGQHSLVIYLLHQPLMFAGFYLLELI